MRVGLVGVGNWGQHILRDLRALGCDVTAVARSTVSRERARAGGATAVCASLDSLGPQDAYVVASPTTLHAEHLRALVPHGKPIYCEKPLTMSSHDAKALGPTAANLVFCMDKWRYHPGVAWLAECARSARLGAVQGVSLIRVGAASPRSAVTSIWHLAPHDLSIALEVLGVLPPLRAATASRLGDWAYGCHALLGSTPWVTIEVNERRAQHYREVRLVCSEGEATLSGAYAKAVIVRRHTTRAVGNAELVPIGEDMPLLAELGAFVAFARGHGPPPKSCFAEALAIVERLEEIHASASVQVHATLVVD